MTKQLHRRLERIEGTCKNHQVSLTNKLKEMSDRQFARVLHYLLAKADLGKVPNPEAVQPLRQLLGLPEGCTLPGYPNPPRMAFYEAAGRIIRSKWRKAEDKQHD